MYKSIIAGIGFLAMMSSAQAEPMKLTSNQMETVTAGAPLVNLQLNLNVVTQVALANAIGVCVGCRSLILNAAAANANFSDLSNQQ